MPDNKQYQRVKEITDQLEQGIQDLFNSEQYMTWLRTMSRFHDYSLNNTLLIAFQRPDATLVAGYTAWQKQFGRQVQKGEKAIHIIAPTPYKEQVEMEKVDPTTQKPVLDADGNPVMETQEVLRPAFKVVNVFDVSQTEGRELPTIGVDELTGDVERYEMFFEALKRTCPVPMEFEQIQGGAKGYYHQLERRIALQKGMSQLQTIKTAIHEMAHQKLHAIAPDQKTSEMPQQSRNSKEVEAESVAYTVCQHFGIDSSDYSFAYIAGWSHGKDTPELKASLQTIRKAASEIITEIEGHMRELEKEQQKERPDPEQEESKEATFMTEDKSYLEIHLTDTGEWDYTLYDAAFQEVDGGRFGEGRSLTIKEACDELLAEYGLSTTNVKELTGLETSIADIHDQIYGNPDFSPEQVAYMVEVAQMGYDLKAFWVHGKPMDLTEYPISAEDIAEIKYQFEAGGIPKMLYTKEQWQQIQFGFEQRLDFNVFAHPEYSPQQMAMLQRGLIAEEKGYITREELLQIADPSMPADIMKQAMQEVFRAHTAERAAVMAPDAGLQESGLYRYYSTQRPIAPGTFPKERNAPVNIVNFDMRSAVEGGQMQAWGYLEYPKPLTQKQAADYELRPAGRSHTKETSRSEQGGKKKSILQDLHEKQAMLERQKKAATQTHKKSKEMDLS